MATPQDRIAQIRAGLARPLAAPSYRPPDLSKVPENYGDWAYYVGGKGPSSSDGGGTPLWMQALDVLAAPQRAITGMLAEGTSEGSSVLSTLGAGWKGLTLQEKRDFDEFLENLGWQDEQGFGWHDVASFAGDVALDPLTYLTFGAGSALKAGTKASQKALREAAKDVGIDVSRQAMKDPAGRGVREIYNKTRERLIQQGHSPEAARMIAESAKNAAQSKIINAGKSARFQAQNRLASIDIPFTNITAPIKVPSIRDSIANRRLVGRELQLPEFLRKREAAIGTFGASVVGDILNRMGVDPAEHGDFLERLFGTRRASELNVQQFDFLRQQERNFQDFARRMEEYAAMNRPSFSRAGLENLFEGTIPSGAIRVGDDAAERVARVGTDALPGGQNIPRIDGGDAIIVAGQSTRRADAKNIVDAEVIVEPLWKQFHFDEFVQDMGGRSRFGDMLGKFTDYFNSRTLRIAGEGLLNRAAKHIKENHARIAGQAQKMQREIAEIQKMAKGMTDEELRAIPYLLEGRFADSGFRPEQVTDQMKKVAERMKGIYQDLAKLEMDAGLLESVRDGYFPHVIKMSAEELQERAAKFKDDPIFSEFVTMHSNLAYSKRRRGFETIAQLDDYIATLQEQLLRTDLDEAAKDVIKEKISILSNLYERNPIDALAKRYYDSIRARAMQDLKNTFREENIILSADEFYANPNATRIANQYQKLSAEESAKMGLGRMEHYVQKDVLEALKRVESIFSEEGLAKFVGYAESVHNIWKMLVTSVVPSHYLYNFIGNVFNNYVAGVRNIRAYREAAEAIVNMRTGRLTKAQEELIQEAAERGILESGFSSDFTRAGIADPNWKIAQIESRLRNSRYVQGMRRNFGDLSDHITRLAHYIDIKRKSGSADFAAESVRKYLFNYTEMTSADRLMRTIIPFWNWTKNNVPLQIMQLMQQPRFYQTYLRLLDGVNDDVQDVAPDWALEEYIHLGGGTMWNPRLPISDLNDDPIRLAVNSVSPFFKAPFEIASNRNFFTQRPIDYDKEYRGEGYSADDLIPYLANTFGGGVVRRTGEFLSGQEGLLGTLRNLLVGRPINVDE